MEQREYNQQYYNTIWENVLGKYTYESPIYDLGDLSRQQYVYYFITKFLNSCTDSCIKIVDFGAGNWLYLGVILQAIKTNNTENTNRRSFVLVGVDYCEQALEFGIEKYKSEIPENVVIHKMVGDINEIANDIANKSYNLVIALETLEHLYDDIGFVTKANDILTDQGAVIISVPNNKPFFLSKNWFIYAFSRRSFSQKDMKVGHLRRYDIKMIFDVIKQLDFQISETKYYGFFLSDYLKSIIGVVEKHFKNLFLMSFRISRRLVLFENEFYNKICVRYSEGLFCFLRRN